MTTPGQTPNPLSRFMRYTSGKEPVLSATTLAAVILAIAVQATKDVIAWDELTLTIAGFVAFGVASFVARHLAWSPESHQAEVDAALQKPPPPEE